MISTREDEETNKNETGTLCVAHDRQTVINTHWQYFSLERERGVSLRDPAMWRSAPAHCTVPNLSVG